jgi:hypothetical protein
VVDPPRHRNNARQRAEACRYEAPSLDRSHVAQLGGVGLTGKDKNARQEWRVKLARRALPKEVGRPRASSLPGDVAKGALPKEVGRHSRIVPAVQRTDADREHPLFVTSWRRWRARICEHSWHEGRAITSFAIVTTDAAPNVAQYHHRMPVVLDDSQFDDWILDAVHARSGSGNDEAVCWRD